MSETSNNGGSRKRKAVDQKNNSDDADKDESSLSRNCPYLDTVNRSVLDFDFEPSCSVSLESGPHVYGCLVCGKFFRGRGRQTPAYTHSVDEGHFIFVHLLRGTFHCLPDDYRVVDPSLADISAALHPTFSTPDIEGLDRNTGLARDLFGRRYLPGFVGLNNLQKTDCFNATIQALAHVRPLRDFFLQRTHLDLTIVPKRKKKRKDKDNNSSKPVAARLSPLVQAFGELLRKMWSDKRFKSHVDPHMLIQAISVASNKRFRVGQQAEAGEFMAWLLHQLHVGLGGTRKPGSSIIHEIFQGKVQVTTRSEPKDGNDANDKKNGDDDEEEDDRGGSDEEPDKTVPMEEEENDDDDKKMPSMVDTTVDTHFLQLTLDITEKPLFRDEDGGLVIPQEPLVSVLKKFDGVTFSEALAQSGANRMKRYRLLRLPRYLILHLSRFKSNRYSREKNPTIVAFPVKNLDLSHYVHKPHGKEKPPTEEEVRSLSVRSCPKISGPKMPKERMLTATFSSLSPKQIKQLKQLLSKHGQSDLVKNVVEKSELVQIAIDFVTKSLPDLLADKYNLVANITHDSPPDVGREGKHDPLQEGSYKCHVQHKATGQWYVMQDLHVEETMPQLIGLSESYLLIFERQC